MSGRLVRFETEDGDDIFLSDQGVIKITEREERTFVPAPDDTSLSTYVRNGKWSSAIHYGSADGAAWSVCVKGRAADAHRAFSPDDYTEQRRGQRVLMGAIGDEVAALIARSTDDERVGIRLLAGVLESIDASLKAKK